jgi:hypothetical protein
VNVQTTVKIQVLRLPYSDSWDRPIEGGNVVQYASIFERLIFIFTYQPLSRFCNFCSHIPYHGDNK